MSRLVEPRSKGAKLFSDEGPGDGIPQRVAKYVPAEIIAVYLFLLPIVINGTDAGSSKREVLLAVIFAICLIATPLYFWRFRDVSKKVRWYHVVLSTFALVVWVYSIPGGFFDAVGGYDSIAAAIIMAVFSLVSGFAGPVVSNANE